MKHSPERTRNLDKDITDTIDTENRRLAVEVDKIFKPTQSFSQEQNEKDTQREFDEIYTKIRQLNSELRRICKKDDEEPIQLDPNVINSFDGIKNEVIPFKIS